MPTLIDELIVRLSLDPTDFNEGQKAAAAAFLKTKGAAKDAADDIEKSGKRASDSIDRVTKSALELFGVLIGARSVGDFVGQVTQLDAATGRLAQNLGVSARAVQQWQAAVQRIGGNSSDADNGLSTAASQLQDFRINANSLPEPLVRLFSSAHMRPDVEHGTQGFISSIAAAAAIDAAKDRTGTAFLLNQAGYGGAFGNVMMNHGGPGLQGYLGGMPVVSDETIRRLTELQAKWASLQQTVTRDFTEDLAKVEPVLGVVLDDVSKIADALGGWRVSLEALAALWAGGKLIGLFGALRGIAGLGAGAAASAGGAPLLGVGVAASIGMSGGPLVESNGDFQAQLRDSALGPPNARAAILRWASAYTSAPAGSSTRSARVTRLRQIASAAGLDPDKFVQLSMGEGFNSYIGDQGSSFGDFQLHMGGMSSAMPGRGLGDEFMAQTGLDPRNSSTTDQQDQWVARYIALHGAAKWSAARNMGIENMMMAANGGNIGGRGTAVGSTTNINGDIIVNSKATDAAGIARDIKPALTHAALAQPANTGMN